MVCLVFNSRPQGPSTLQLGACLPLGRSVSHQPLLPFCGLRSTGHLLSSPLAPKHPAASNQLCHPSCPPINHPKASC